MKVNNYALHPTTEREIKKGHYWVIEDQYTKKIPEQTNFFIGENSYSERIGYFIHDPQHPRVKARLWSRNSFAPKSFEDDLCQRIGRAITKRRELNIDSYRDHYYLCFGEIDELPGLHLIKLGNNIVIQVTAFYWKKYLEVICKEIKKKISDVESIFYHQRSVSYSKQAPPELIWGEVKNNEVSEFTYKMKTHLGQSYDYGIYTDMSCIRKILPKALFEGKSVLNLFSYTGAYSLLAEHHGASAITSVDSFKKVLETFKEDITLSEYDESIHEIVHSSCEKFFKRNEEKFDFIICDPPSSYSVKGKRKKSIDFYKETLKSMDSSLNTKGKLLLFLNTHSIKLNKFEETISKGLNFGSSQYRIIKHYKLNEDCPSREDFPEGNYLKGLLIEKVK